MGDLDIIGSISERETIARGNGIRDLNRLRSDYGEGRWRKCKGRAKVRLVNGAIVDAEIHWYEAQGKGRVEEKIKRTLK